MELSVKILMKSITRVNYIVAGSRIYGPGAAAKKGTF
jgi:hypothetical protein